MERSWKDLERWLQVSPKRKDDFLFSSLMLLGVSGEQIAEAARLMSGQGPDTFDLIKKQTSF